MLSRGIWEIRFAAAGALTWGVLLAVFVAAAVVGYLAGPWAVAGAGLAGIGVLYWLVGPLVARVQGSVR